MNRRRFLSGTALGAVGAVAGCIHGGDGGGEDGGDDESTNEPAPQSGVNYQNLSYEITERGEDVMGSVGHSYVMGQYELFGSFTVGPEDCYTSAVIDVSVTEETAEVLVGPVKKDGAPEECSGPVVEHAFTVSFESDISAEQYLLKAEDHEEGEIVVHDSEDSGF